MIDCTQVILDCDAHIRYAGYFKKIDISVIRCNAQTPQSIVKYKLCFTKCRKGFRYLGTFKKNNGSSTTIEKKSKK